jgi:membrane protease YdiL (CAAX protease family)
LALVITFAARAIPGWFYLIRIWQVHLDVRGGISYETFHDLVLLVMGLTLALPTRSRSGLRIGRIRGNWRRVGLVCGLPLLLTAIIYPSLRERPFAAAGASMWLVSPLAQDLVFMGFLYGRLEPLFASNIHTRIPVRRALVVTAVYFALWHLPNFGVGVSVGFVTCQLIYTAVGFVVIGLSRQWTGSILYGTLTHSAINLVAWLAG